MTNIISNGSKWGLENPDTIEELLQALASFPLDPMFERYGNFVITDLRKCTTRRNPVTMETEYINGELIYPEHPNAVRFWGNFQNVSHVFQIDTDEPENIEKLTAAIRANQQREDYMALRTAA